MENYRVGWRIGGDTSRNFERSVNSTRVDSFSSSRMTNTDDGLSGAGRRREPRGRHHVCVLAPRRKRARIHARILPSTCAIISHEGGRRGIIRSNLSFFVPPISTPSTLSDEFVKRGGGRKIIFFHPFRVSLLLHCFRNAFLRLKIIRERER